MTVSRELSWSHLLAILPPKDALQRDFYAQMTSTEHWSVRTLRDRIAPYGSFARRRSSHVGGNNTNPSPSSAPKSYRTRLSIQNSS